MAEKMLCSKCRSRPKNEHKQEISDREFRESQEHPRFDET